jgi:hypothetical protein
MDGAKTRKKQASEPEYDALLENSLLVLEDVCARSLAARFADRDDSERMYWQQRFKNIVTPISLALAEVRGPRVFHQHYRHDENDSSILRPVLEDPYEMLAHACEKALEESSLKLMGVHDDDLIAAQRRLEKALNNFLHNYNL